MKIRAKTILAAAALSFSAAAAAGVEGGILDGWSPKFYDGLEAVGAVEVMPGGFKGKEASIRLKWEYGAMLPWVRNWGEFPPTCHV